MWDSNYSSHDNGLRNTLAHLFVYNILGDQLSYLPESITLRQDSQKTLVLVFAQGFLLVK